MSGLCRRSISVIFRKTNSPTYSLPGVLQLLEASRQWCVFIIVSVLSCGYVWFSAQMQFKYAQKGDDGGALFEKGVVLARQCGRGSMGSMGFAPRLCQMVSSMFFYSGAISPAQQWYLLQGI